MMFRRMAASRAALLCALSLTAPSALAQSVPTPVYNIGSAVREADEARRAPPPSAAAAPVLPQLAEPRLTLSGKDRLFVKSFVVDDCPSEDDAALREIVAPHEGRKLTLAQIYAVADQITAYYRAKGYLLAKAYVPAQDARKGALRIKLLPGRYGSVMVKNNSLVDDEILQDFVEQPRNASPIIRKEALERAMLLVSDLHGAATPRIVVSPGRAQGESDLVFDVPEENRVTGYLFGDNVGSPYTGRDRLNGGVSVNSPLGIGDRLTASGIVSEQANLANARVAYSLPIGPDGLRAEIGAYRTTYALTGVYDALDATGRAEAVTATLTYAALRQRDESVYVWSNFTYKWLNDKIAGQTIAGRRLALGAVGVNYDTLGDLFSLPFVTSSSLSFTGGSVEFPDPTQYRNNIRGAHTAGDYYRVNLSVNATLAIDENVSFSTTLRAQKALNRNLDSSEQMGVAGSYGVRSFDQGLAGDSGFVVTPELKYALPIIERYRHSIGVFTDIGAAWLEDGSYTVSQRSYTQIAAVGAGYSATYEYSDKRFLLLKAEVAHSYGGNHGAAAYDRHTKGLVQIGFTF
ncbi:ShlB/FhaC/HecB family hemolysin secretion/activation protein [Methylosinus trichosporium OB3b]|uniref:ShlB/FhaC/HecB family hemolysin secretion/activation protein n=2 Tax=Methylocystaceae TaxID=31993 RepID=A0A2D2D1G2_METT3|nr:ShlB/FhaC/HecB family hemolysin secretion/activation protein [Methylosinus trichosporium OB3b]OBS52246.1 hemin-binding protein [Methylosinus sp. 3S-1]